MMSLTGKEEEEVQEDQEEKEEVQALRLGKLSSFVQVEEKISTFHGDD